jgi:hypothetical protein
MISYAMLSPKDVFPPRSQAVHQRAFRSPASIPSVTLMISYAMLSPKDVFPAQQPSCPPKSPPQSSLNPPLCDLRDLCAMLSPKDVFLAQKPSCPSKSLPQSNFNPPL